MTDKAPVIKVIKVKEYQVKQSKYEYVSKLPTRSVINAASGSGKSVLIQNLILETSIHETLTPSLFTQNIYFKSSIAILYLQCILY